MGGLAHSPRLLVVLAGTALIVGGCALAGASRSDEVRLGRQAAGLVDQQFRTWDDPALSNMGQHLVLMSDRSGYPYQFRVLDDPSINAFALPGGPVYVTSGMMDFTRDHPDQLAAVVAHEIAHVARRHAVEQIHRRAWLDMGADLLTGGTTQQVSQLASHLDELGYTRAQEQDADTCAAVYLLRGGTDPMAEVRLLERLRAGGGGKPDFVKTHPVDKARIGRLRNQITTTEINELAGQEGL